MANKNPTITINGKVYDAQSGKPIGGKPSPTPASPVSVASEEAFVVPVRKTTTPLKLHDSARANPAHRKPEAAKTLMRAVVKRPTPIVHEKSAVKTLKIAGVTTQAEAGQPVPQHPGRLKRAKEIPKSELVSRFADTERIRITKRSEAVPIARPVAEASPSHTARAIAQPAAKESMFEEALANITAQPQILNKKLRSSQKIAHKLGVSATAINVGASALVVLLLVAFFGLQNISTISMHEAASKAGIHATLPHYKPSGFAMAGPIHYSSGQVIVSFHSNTDSRAFDISQSTSNMSQAQLAAVYSSKQTQTYRQAGRKIYIYNSSNAVWISNGVLYRVQGNSDLNSTQLLRLAASF